MQKVQVKLNVGHFACVIQNVGVTATWLTTLQLRRRITAQKPLEALTLDGSPVNLNQVVFAKVTMGSWAWTAHLLWAANSLQRLI